MIKNISNAKGFQIIFKSKGSAVRYYGKDVHMTTSYFLPRSNKSVENFPRQNPIEAVYSKDHKHEDYQKNLKSR